MPTMTERIAAQLMQNDLTPIYSVIADIIRSFKPGDFDTLSPQARTKAAKDLAALTPLAHPNVLTQVNVLNVESLSDVDMLRELAATRAQLAQFLPLSGEAQPVPAHSLAQSLLDTEPRPAEGPGGLGLLPAEPVDVPRDPEAHKTPKTPDANSMAARLAALGEPAPAKPRGRPRKKSE